MLLMFLGGSLIPVCKVQVSVRCTATLTIPIRSNQPNAHFLVDHPEWNPMKSHNAVSQPTYPTLLYTWGRYTHDLKLFHGWRHHLTSYKIDSFTNHVGHHVVIFSALCESPWFFGWVGLCRSFAPASTRRDCVWGAWHDERNIIAAKWRRFFQYLGIMYGFFFTCLFVFFVFEWVLVWVWFSRIVFWKKLIKL